MMRRTGQRRTYSVRMVVVLGLVTVAGMPAWATELAEDPAPLGGIRLIRLARCAEESPLQPDVKASLASAASLVRGGNGADGITELELCVADHPEAGSALLMLAQCYLAAAWGRPDLAPREGTLAASGDRDRDLARWVDRAFTLLEAAEGQRPDDAVVDYLRAEVWRLRHDDDAAATSEYLGMRKCSYIRSLEMVKRLQRLQSYPAAVVGELKPHYPEAAAARGITGTVTLDLLVDPEGRVEQVVTVSGPPLLAGAVEAAARDAGYQAGRVGAYPVWCWLRVSVGFGHASTD